MCRSSELTVAGFGRFIAGLDGVTSTRVRCTSGRGLAGY
jgi:hypothetical protein